MTNANIYRRHIVGVLSLVLVAAAVIMYLTIGDRQDQTSFYIGVCVRLGLVLGSIWLAWPQLIKLEQYAPKILVVGLAIILLVGVIFSKKLLPIAIAFVVAAIGLQLVMRFFSSRAG